LPSFYIYRSQANGFDGKSDGKILLGVLFRNFTVKPIRGTREALEITEVLPLWIAEFGKSLSFPSTANPEAGDRWKSLSPNFMADSIPQSAYRYTREFRGKYTRNSYRREPAPGKTENISPMILRIEPPDAVGHLLAFTSE
jgi:hypothetical protein